MDNKLTWQNAMIELHTARNAESTEKLMSPQALMPPLRSLFTICIQQISHLDSDNLFHQEGFHPEMESIILTYWRSDQHKLLTTLLQCSDSALHSP